ncbi:MAG: glycoside hydrolase family 3 C-terminal domain-containing protein [Oscillospiraceae bacterium]
MKYSEIISKMTLEEKASLCSGGDYWNTKAIPSVGIPSIMMTDGPHGLRKRTKEKTKEQLTSLAGVPAICFPTAATTACSWDTDLIAEMGDALGEECLKEQISILLGPGINIKRSPTCGRNFEYFSEDPFLAGKYATSFINGVQARGIGTSLKHFAANNQEACRLTVNSVVDERTLREIYLAGFEMAVKESQPWTIMAAYNRLNDTHCTENKWLLTDVLRNEWGFKGIVVTDWGAENDRVEGLLAGQELEMPTSSGRAAKQIIAAVESGIVEESLLDENVDRLIDLAFRGDSVRGEDYTYDAEAHHALARKIAEQSMVLMKNDGILPLSKDKTVAVIGEMAKAPRYQGAGSSLINPIKVDNTFDAILDMGVKAIYAAGYNKKKDVVDNTLFAQAVEAAKSAEIAIVCIGLTESYEAEGFDRNQIRIPTSHVQLLNAVKEVNPNVVVVLFGGSVVEMPWLSKANALLNTYLSGQAGGSAIANILFGEVNPSGKLAETYPIALSDNPSYCYMGTNVSVEYREGIYVGYRYYDTAKKDVLFPFGFGLSYTSFEYSDLKLSNKKINDTDELTVTFKIKNTGKVDGAEVAQLYVRDIESQIYRPLKELKGFTKVFLAAGEEKEVSITLDKRSFAYYNVLIHDWHIETGDFEILIGASSRDIKLSDKVFVKSTVDAKIPSYKENAPCYYGGNISDVSADEFKAVYGRELPPSVRDKSIKLDITNTLEDAKDGKWGSRIVKMVTKLVVTATGSAEDGMEVKFILQTPIRNYIAMSMGAFTPEMANGLLLILNDESAGKGLSKILGGLGHVISNIGTLIKSI